MKKHLSTLLLLLVLLVGVSLLLYPTVSDYYNSFHRSRAIATYVQQVDVLDEDLYTEDWQAAIAYNQTLPGKRNRFYMSDEEREAYDKLLDVTGLGIIGYIEIPTIDVSLPIYHGTSEGVLQIAIGHIEGSSLPTGGPGTHSAFSGHRGLPSAKLFTRLDEMAVGDLFTLRVLDEVMTYEVDQITIVEPYDVSGLDIEEGADLCTLVTCTPYGVNTHRLLVRGHRVENPEQAVAIRVVADATQIDPLLVAPVVAAPILLILLVVLMVSTAGSGKKKRKER